MSKSKIEELIGVLWFILTILLIQNESEILWKITFILGLVSQIAAIIYAVKTKAEQALKGGMKNEDNRAEKR